MENIYFTFFTETGASLVTQMVKNLPAMQKTRVWSLCREDPRRREWQPTPVFLPGEFHGQRSLVGYSLWSCKRIRHNWATNAFLTETTKLSSYKVAAEISMQQVTWRQEAALISTEPRVLFWNPQLSSRRASTSLLTQWNCKQLCVCACAHMFFWI